MVLRSSMQKALSSLLLINAARKYKGKVSLIKIRAAQSYVLGIKKARTFLLGASLMAIALMLLASGLILIQFAVFAYSNWSKEVKLMIACLLGGAELLTAAGIMVYLFREKSWIKYTGVQKLIDTLRNGKNQGNGKGDSDVA